MHHTVRPNSFSLAFITHSGEMTGNKGDRAREFMVGILTQNYRDAPLPNPKTLTLKPSLNTFEEILHPNSHCLKLVVTKIEADTNTQILTQTHTHTGFAMQRQSSSLSST